MRLILFILFSISLFASSEFLNYAILNNQAFPIKKNIRSFKLAYLRLNDALDFFNIREQELGDLANEKTSIGNLDGFETEFIYSWSNDNSIFLNWQNINLVYWNKKLRDNKITIFNRWNFYRHRLTLRKKINFALDFGLTVDKSEDIKISDSRFLNSMLNKIKPNSGYTIQDDGTIEKDGSEISIYDDNGNRIIPTIVIQDLSFNQYFFQLNAGMRIFRKSVTNLYFKYSYLNINSEISAVGFENIPTKDLGRDEHIFTTGFSWTSDFNFLLFELDYSFSKILREELHYKDYSHKLEIALSKPIKRNFLIFVSGKIMFQQFIEDLPYLYNQYTETQFDKKYGFAKFGFIYKF